MFHSLGDRVAAYENKIYLKTANQPTTSQNKLWWLQTKNHDWNPQFPQIDFEEMRANLSVKHRQEMNYVPHTYEMPFCVINTLPDTIFIFWEACYMMKSLQVDYVGCLGLVAKSKSEISYHLPFSFTFYFEIIIDSQEGTTNIQGDSIHPSPSLPQC